MKSLICSIILILSFAYGQAQLYPVTQSVGNTPTTKVKTNALEGKLILTTFTDTTAANTEGYLKNYDGALIKTTTPINAVWYRVLDSAKWVQILPQGGGTPVSGQAWVVGGNNNLFTDGNNNATFGTNQTNGIYVKTDGVTRLYLDKYGIAPETINSVGLGYDPTDSNRITLFSGSGGSGWSLTGNAGTDSGTNFIGTTDYMPLMFRVNNTRFGVIDPTSSLGFGSNVLLVNEGTGNVALGTNVLSKNTTGLGNVAIGTNASRFNITGLRNIALGQSALDSSTAGSTNIAIGYRAANRYNSDNIIAIGTEALSSSTVAGVGIGTNALRYNTGTFNVGVGNSVLASATSTGGFNTAVGNNALSVNTTGTGHVAIGASALIANTTGDKNTAVGSGALEANIGGSQNTSVGQDNQYQATSGNLNTSIGYEGMNNRSTGTGNTASGYRGGGSLTTGSYNSFFGYQSGSNASQKVDASRSGAFGTDSYTDCDTCISIGAPYNLKTILYGDTIRMPDLPTSGTYYKNVVANANGDLFLRDTAAVTTVNIYNSDGTIGGDRVVNGGSFVLQFTNLNVFKVSDAIATITLDATELITLSTSEEINIENTHNGVSPTINIKPAEGQLYIDTLTNAVGTHSLRYNPTTGLVSYADTTIGSGGISGLTTNELVYGNSATTIASLPVATYPSLTELSYLKGVTSSIQTQLNGKQATITFGTGVQTALGVNIGSAGAPVLFDGALGTPSSGTLTNATGLPVSTGISGLGSGVATFLATASSANLRSALTDENGTGAALFDGATSPDFTTGVTIGSVAVPTISSTNTLTNKRITARVTTTASSSTPTPDGDASDMYTVTALAAGATFAAPTGTPTDGQKLLIRIKDDGTARTLAWNAIYRGGADIALPATTVISLELYCQFVYNAAASKWDLVGLTQMWLPFMFVIYRRKRKENDARGWRKKAA